MHQCFSNTSLFILINSSPFGMFCPTRGICQGDLLSPLLFILCSEVLSRLLLKEENSGRLKGIKVGRAAPSISHLLFADDLLLFGKAILREASILDECLDKYMVWSSQKVNCAKSSVHFSKKFHGQHFLPILDKLQLKKMPSKAKHLGLPLLIPRLKEGAAVKIKERFLKKITRWKAKVLSQAGRTLMIKAVAGAMPSSLLSYFAMPKSWCKDLDRELKNLWWGYKAKKSRNLSLKAWTTICTLKQSDGLGIRIVFDFNAALISKLSWIMLNHQDRLWVRVLGGKYLRGRTFLEAGMSTTDSWIWKGIVPHR